MALAIEGSKEAILFSPNQIVVFLTHANAIDQVEMGEGNHCNRVETLDKRETITEPAIVNFIAQSADGPGKAIFFDLSVEELFDVVDVETGRRVVEFCVPLALEFVLSRVDVGRSIDLIADRVQVALVNVLAVPDPQALKTKP